MDSILIVRCHGINVGKNNILPLTSVFANHIPFCCAPKELLGNNFSLTFRTFSIHLIPIDILS